MMKGKTPKDDIEKIRKKWLEELEDERRLPSKQ